MPSSTTPVPDCGGARRNEPAARAWTGGVGGGTRAPRRPARGPPLRGAVPEEAAREFALRYVLHFDNFTPSTLDATHQVLQRMIAARSWSGATQALEKRRQVVQEGRMSSQVIPLSARVTGMNVTVEAVRRTF